MRREYKFILKSANKNFFLSIYLLLRYFIFKKLNNRKIKDQNLQSSYQKIIQNDLRIEQDWFSHNINSLDLFFKKKDYYNKEINMLEIGSYEGNSSVFFLKYFSKLKLTCVDTFEGSVEQGNKDFNKVYDNFKFNVDNYKEKLKVVKDTSGNFFNKLNNDLYDLIYIDGSHHHEDVLTDAKNSFKVLNKGGYLIFDDFLWSFYSNANENPIGGIKSFLKENFFKVDIVSIGYQIILKKN